MVTELSFGDGLTGDLHLPEGPGPHPILIGVPGGAWKRGHRRDLARWGAWLARRGIGLFSIDYQRATNGKAFPQALHDVLAAQSFLHAKAAEFGLDESRIGILGASAGGHLAALAALTSEQPLRCLVGIYGVYDLFSHWQECLSDNPPAGGSPAEYFLGAAPFHDQALYFSASPLRQITYQRNKLPVFLSWGDGDEAVWPSQSEAFFRALRQAHYPVHRWVIPGAGHFWFSQEDPEQAGSFAAFLAPALLRFLKRELAVAS
jgi:acetyl esterase/lipase